MNSLIEEKSNCLLSNCFQYLIVFFVDVKYERSRYWSLQWCYFWICLVWTQKSCQKYIERDRAGKSSKKRAVVDGHSDNLSSIKKLLWWLPHIMSPGTSVIVPNRPFARWHHFTSTTRILQGFAFLCKLGRSLFKPHWDYKINMKGKTKRIMVVVVKWRHRANGL